MVSTDEVVLRLAEAQDEIERLKLIIERERRTSSAAIRDRECYRVRGERAEQAEVCLLDHVADLKAKLAQSEVDAKDHARIRARIEELQAALEMAQESRFMSATCVTAPDGRIVPMQMWTADDVRAQAIADTAEPELAAAMMAEHSLETARQVLQGESESRRGDNERELAEAKAVNAAQDEYERTARGEPTTEACPVCGGAGIRSDGDKCPRCSGSGFALVHNGAPEHLDIAREGATDAAMSLDAHSD